MFIDGDYRAYLGWWQSRYPWGLKREQTEGEELGRDRYERQILVERYVHL
jgi:hypothetical protein